MIDVLFGIAFGVFCGGFAALAVLDPERSFRLRHWDSVDSVDLTPEGKRLEILTGIVVFAAGLLISYAQSSWVGIVVLVGTALVVAEYASDDGRDRP